MTPERMQEIRERLEEDDSKFFTNPWAVQTRQDRHSLLSAHDTVVADNAALVMRVNSIRRFAITASVEYTRTHGDVDWRVCALCDGSWVDGQTEVHEHLVEVDGGGWCPARPLEEHPSTALLARHTEELAAKDAAFKAALTHAEAMELSALRERDEARREIARLRKGLEKLATRELNPFDRGDGNDTAMQEFAKELLNAK